MPKKTKASLEFMLVKSALKGIPEKGLLRSRNIGQVDLIWSTPHGLFMHGTRHLLPRPCFWYNST